MSTAILTVHGDPSLYPHELAAAREQDKRAAEYLKKIPGARSIEVIDSPARAIQHGGALK